MSQTNTTEACLKAVALPEPIGDLSNPTGSDDEFMRETFVTYHDTKRDLFFRRKYLLDRCVGGALLAITSPLTLSLFVVVKLTSPGPGFYRQERVGLNGESFEIIKLRSMVRNAEKPGEAVWCVKNDSRVTRIGRILRKLHLDELPQLWNVAKGEMSLVGPRPERPEICEDLAEEIDGYYQRNTIKPGVTGLAQINLPPDETVDDVRLKQILDLRYIEEANLWLDTRMVLATAMRMTGVRGVTVMKAMRLCRRDYLTQSCEPATSSENGPFRVDSSDAEFAYAMSGMSQCSAGDTMHRRPK